MIAVRALEVGSLLGTTAALVWMLRRSRAEGRIRPELYLTVAFMSTGWMEPLYDWGLHVYFHESFVRAPDWGPMALAPNGLPAIGAFAYAVYFLAAAALGRLAADRFGLRFGLTRPRALLAFGFVVGFAWDATVELIGTQAHLWSFHRVATGWVPFAGSAEQLAWGMPISMAFVIMVTTYLLDATGGEFQPTVWARRIFGARRERLGTLITVVAVFHALMGIALAPSLLARAAGLTTVVNPEVVFDIPSAAPPAGTLLYVVWVGVATAVAAQGLLRKDRTAAASAAPVPSESRRTS